MGLLCIHIIEIHLTMNKKCFILTLSLLGLLSFSSLPCFAQSYFTNQALDDFEDYIRSMDNSKWKSISKKRKSRRIRDSEMNYNDYFQQSRIQAERESEYRRAAQLRLEASIREEMRKADERRTAEFKRNHKVLKAGLRDVPEKSGLVGLPGYSNYGLRGIDYSTTDNMRSQTTNTSVMTYSDKQFPETQDSKKYEPRYIPESKLYTKPFYGTRSEYIAAATTYGSQPMYYQGNKIWVKEEAWDFSQIRDVWQDQGEKNVKGYMIGKVSQWVKERVAGFSSMGNGVVGLYETLKRATSIKNTEISLVKRSLNTVKNAVKYGKYDSNTDLENVKDIYKLSGEVGIPQLPTNQEETIGWFQRLLLDPVMPYVVDKSI